LVPVFAAEFVGELLFGAAVVVAVVFVAVVVVAVVVVVDVVAVLAVVADVVVVVVVTVVETFTGVIFVEGVGESKIVLTSALSFSLKEFKIRAKTSLVNVDDCASDEIDATSSAAWFKIALGLI